MMDLDVSLQQKLEPLLLLCDFYSSCTRVRLTFTLCINYGRYERREHFCKVSELAAEDEGNGCFPATG